ncbi:transposase [Streptomyces sp. W16]|uniref:transposase n=1 Tax=Streptomyces sp. W16 TaxID=3076631 RepID=UPI00295B8831|nr:transposase [Streptomyces sp. W16]MDV9169818.1 transposase [Streptomyces sp. W16]
MTDAEWTVVRDALPVPAWLEGRGGQPEGYCHRQMLDAVFYVTDNGIKWRSVPADFPAWDRVYAFFRRWRENGLVRELHDRLRGKVRTAEGRQVEPTLSARVGVAALRRGDRPVPVGDRGRVAVQPPEGLIAQGQRLGGDLLPLFAGDEAGREEHAPGLFPLRVQLGHGHTPFHRSAGHRSK